MARQLPLHPLGLALSPALTLYASNPEAIRPVELVAPLAIWLVGVVGFGLLVWLWLRDVGASAVLASVAALLTGGFGSARRLATSVLGHAPGDLALAVLALCWALAIGLAALALRRRPAAAASLHAPFNVVAAVMVLLPIGTAILSPVVGPSPLVLPERARPALAQRDLYLVVLDGAGRGDVLASRFGIDARTLTAPLEQLGFEVVPRGRANYMRTLPALAALLNFAELDPVALGTASDPSAALASRIEQGRLLPLLAREGYAAYLVPAGFGTVDRLPGAARVAPAPPGADGREALLDMTPLPVLFDALGVFDRAEAQRERVRFWLDALRATARRPGPKLVFAHLLAPHPPFVFGAQGEPVLRGSAHAYDGSHFYLHSTPAVYRRGYAGQVAFLSRAVPPVLRAILEGAREAPVVLVLGDHGPGLGLAHDSLEHSDLEERFGVLLAAYLPPDLPRPALPPDATPVTLLRILLAHYWGYDLPAQPGRSYFNPESEPLGFVEVTDRLDGRGESRAAPDR